MTKVSVSRALVVPLLIITLSACAVSRTVEESGLLPGSDVLEPVLSDAGEQQQSAEESSQATAQTELPMVGERLFIDLYREANPAVVNIRVSKLASSEGQGDGVTPQLPEFPQIPGLPIPDIPDLQPMPQHGQGSGFIYGEQGDIVTNNHVIAGADEITVVFFDGSEADATLVGADPDTDLAVIRVEEMPDETIVPLRLADSDSLEIGQFVVAIGNPFGLSGSMTTGIISGLGRILPASASQFSIPDIVQTDAAINPGNSGGPLLNLAGEVIGVNTAIATTTRAFAGVGYAVPANTVKDVVPELIAHGRVQHPWLGISGRTMDRDTAEAMALDSNQRGVLVVEIVADGPAAEAALRGSDTSTTIDGQQVRIGGDVIVGIDTQTVADFDDLLSYIVGETRVGQTVTLRLLRDGQQVEIEVTLDARPVADGADEAP